MQVKSNFILHIPKNVKWSKPIKNPYVKDTGEKYCKITPCELTGGKFIIHILHILL